jgi:hypothetical protein
MDHSMLIDVAAATEGGRISSLSTKAPRPFRILSSHHRDAETPPR